MKISTSWLADWIDDVAPLETLAEALTLAGHEVDEALLLGEGLHEFVVAEILRVEAHPNADRLKVCQVSIAGDESFQIVCGAPNARAGLRSILAPAGTKMPDGNKIRRSKLRGVESQGMLCSARELGFGDEHDGIMELPENAPVGKPVAEYLGLPDGVLDLDLTPNRGDCFSVLGIAREIAATSDASLTPPVFTDVAPLSEQSCPVSVLASEACPRFVSRLVVGIDTNATSPLWMTERLRRAGLRAISPVVDVTNYVMLELGQPLHAYDNDKIRGPIVVRMAQAGEALTLLDDKALQLADDVVVIADDTGAIGMAGIMGGLSTAVSESTTNVLFEGAFWTPDFIAGRARRYGMHTDASLRFERGVDPEQQQRAVNRAVELIVAIAGGETGPISEVVEVRALPIREPIQLNFERVNRLLGHTLGKETIVSILENLGMAVTVSGDGLEATPPAFRFDLQIAEDLIEEVARVYGYDAIPAVTAWFQSPLTSRPEAVTPEAEIRDFLISGGFNEIITYSFLDPVLQRQLLGDAEEIALANPISSELSVMRSSLLPGLVKTLLANKARQRNRLRLFELGNCFDATSTPPENMRIGGVLWGNELPEQWAGERRASDYYDGRNVVEGLLGHAAQYAHWSASQHPALHPGQSAQILLGDNLIGDVGILHPRLVAELELDPAPVFFELDLPQTLAGRVPSFTPVSRFPAVRRDLAVLVSESTPVGVLLASVKAAGGELLRDVRLFDNYQGKGIEAGLKSVALGLILQETSRTLTDEDTDSVVGSIREILEREHGARLRDR